MNERIAEVISEYDGQGRHRTGTDVDLLSARWLARHVELSGFEPHLEPFSLSRVAPQRCHLEIAGTVIDGLPLFDGSFTGSEGIKGRLGPSGSDAEIGLIESPVSPDASLDEARRAGKHAALVTVVRPMGDQPGLAPRNAPNFTTPFGPPALQIDSEKREWLKDEAERRAPCRLVAEVGREDVDAFNVVTVVPGRDRSLSPLVVMTPRSGWWQCAAERGGGIACWLEMLRALRDDQPTRDVRFVATSGHELGHLGLNAYIDLNPSLAKDAVAWIHLGASIGAALDPRPRFFASDPDLQQIASDAMAAETGDTPAFVPLGTVPGGEAKEIHEQGGRYISIAGGHATFHQEADRWPHAVNMDSVAGYARAFVDIVARLSSRM